MEDGDDLTGWVSPTQRATVEAMLGGRDVAPRLRERLEMVKGAALGWDVAAIAAWCGRTPRTVRRWLAAARGRDGPGGVGGGCRRRSTQAGAGLRLLDLGPVERVSGRNYRHAD